MIETYVLPLALFFATAKAVHWWKGPTHSENATTERFIKIGLFTVALTVTLHLVIK
jgi:hypothetical protein